jgi:hypothetical protein
MKEYSHIIQMGYETHVTHAATLDPLDPWVVGMDN